MTILRLIIEFNFLLKIFNITNCRHTMYCPLVPLHCEPRNTLAVVLQRQRAQWELDKENELYFADEGEYFNFINSNYRYDECGLSPCIQCGELYPCKFDASGGINIDKEIFQCEACERLVFENPQLTQFEMCANYCAILSSPNWYGRFKFFRDKIDYYTDISYQYQRRKVNVDDGAMNEDYYRNTIHVHECYPLDEQFKWSRCVCKDKIDELYYFGASNCPFSPSKIAQLYFTQLYSFGAWLDVMAIPVDCDEDVNGTSIVCNFHGEELHSMLRYPGVPYAVKWYFGINDNKWRSDIVQTLNFDYNMYLLRQKHFVQLLLPYVEHVNDLAVILHEYIWESNYYDNIHLDMDCMDDDKYSCIYFCQRRGVWWCSLCADNKVVYIYWLNDATIQIFDDHIASHKKQ